MTRPVRRWPARNATLRGPARRAGRWPCPAPVGLGRDLLAGHAAGGEHLTQRQHHPGLAEQVDVAAAGRQFRRLQRRGQGLRVAGRPVIPGQPGQADPAGRSGFCSSAASGTSRNAVARPSGGSEPVIANTAASPDSSAANRCQSASLFRKILPRGAMPSIVSPGWADRTHRSPGPSPCRTMSRVEQLPGRVQVPDRVPAADRAVAVHGHQQHDVLAGLVGQVRELRRGQHQPLHVRGELGVADDRQPHPDGARQRPPQLGERVIQLRRGGGGNRIRHSTILCGPRRDPRSRGERLADWRQPAGLG